MSENLGKKQQQQQKAILVFMQNRISEKFRLSPQCLCLSHSSP